MRAAGIHSSSVCVSQCVQYGRNCEETAVRGVGAGRCTVERTARSTGGLPVLRQPQKPWASREWGLGGKARGEGEARGPRVGLGGGSWLVGVLLLARSKMAAGEES